MSGKDVAFLDTSCLVRYLTDDPPAMAERAAAIIDSEAILTLSEVVVVETAYVLESFYEVARDPLVESLMAFIQRRNVGLLEVDKPLLLEALRLCLGSKRVSFADAVLWSQARQRGASRIYSFDRRFPSEGIEIVGDAAS